MNSRELANLVRFSDSLLNQILSISKHPSPQRIDTGQPTNVQSTTKMKAQEQNVKTSKKQTSYTYLLD